VGEENGSGVAMAIQAGGDATWLLYGVVLYALAQVRGRNLRREPDRSIRQTARKTV
jgi:hypothetical protein